MEIEMIQKKIQLFMQCYTIVAIWAVHEKM